MNMGWFDEEKHASGILSARLSTDATKVENLVGTRLGISISNLATIVAGLVIAFFYGWKLTLVILAMSPTVAFANAMQFLGAKG